MLRFFLLVFSTLLLVACGNNKPETVTFSGSTMGTRYNISIVSNEALRFDVAAVKAAVDSELKIVDEAMSTYKDSSEISIFNRSAVGSKTIISPITQSVIEEALKLSEFTKGALNVTVGPLVDAWGFGGQSVTHNQIVSSDAVKNALSLVGMERFSIGRGELLKEKEVRVDLSAIAKGFAVDRVASVIDDFGITNYLVEIGGEVVAKGLSPRNSLWVLGIESPDKKGRSVYTRVGISGKALATSGDYRNFFELDGNRYSHTINPSTGFPVDHNLGSVSVVAESCMLADGLATALMVMGEVDGFRFAQEHNISAYFIYRNGKGLETMHTSSFEKYLK